MGTVPESPPEELWATGTLVADRYRVVRVIGQGGMGAVYAAEQVEGGMVALKVALGEAVEDPRLKSRFLREARTASTIDHPNAVRVIEVIEHAGRPALVMELLAGKNLGERLQEVGRLSLGETARLMVPVLGALAAAHAKGIVHRDLKPDNIFLSRVDGEVVPKVVDFGIAKSMNRAAGEESLKLTSTGTMLGTPYYMAPEQAAARPTFDHRVDLWAIGVVLYEMLTGYRPFDGQVFGQIFAAIFSEEPAPIRKRAPELPDKVVALIARCLAKQPKDRPDTAGEIAEVLAQYASLPSAEYPKPQNTLMRIDGDDALAETPPAEGDLQAEARDALRRSRDDRATVAVGPHVTDRVGPLATGGAAVPAAAPRGRAPLWGAVALALAAVGAAGYFATRGGAGAPAVRPVPATVAAPPLVPATAAPLPAPATPPAAVAPAPALPARLAAAAPDAGAPERPAAAHAHSRPARPKVPPSAATPAVPPPPTSGIIDKL